MKKVKKRFVRKGTGVGFDFLEESVQEPADEEYVCVPTKAGTLVLIHGSVYHKSEKNSSDKGRIIYTFHVIEVSGNELILISGRGRVR